MRAMQVCRYAGIYEMVQHILKWDIISFSEKCQEVSVVNHTQLIQKGANE